MGSSPRDRKQPQTEPIPSGASLEHLPSRKEPKQALAVRTGIRAGEAPINVVSDYNPDSGGIVR